MLKDVIAQLNSPGFSKELDPPKNDIFDDNESSQLKSDDIEYFDPAIKEKGSVIIIKRHIFYKDVYVFMNRLKDVTVNKDNEKIRKALLTYFRNETLI